LPKKAIIIGAGFAGLSTACYLAKSGWQVTVIEKNNTVGGRAKQLVANGFTFDMGPSWYWMPDVFESFFNNFNKQVAQLYSLTRLSPSYKIFWKNDSTDIPANYNELKILFDSLEENGGQKLDSFLAEAAFKYNVGINKLVYKPGLSVLEFIDKEVLLGIIKLDVFSTMKTHVAKYFSHPKIIQLLEFPILFLGAMPNKIPALYSLMNYADIVGGTWYPVGGMYKVVEAMYSVANELGVQFLLNENVTKIEVENDIATNVFSTNLQNNNSSVLQANVVVAAADYNFVETQLLSRKYRSYSQKYWDKRVLAPSCLLYYVGINKKLKNATHHTLFFDTSFDVHGNEIYNNPQWPSDPLFYVSVTSVTDSTTAPENCENLFFLIPVAAGLLNDDEALKEKYFTMILQRYEARIGETISSNIVYKKSYSVSDFKSDYNSFKGNAYGLANTLLQTSILKPKCKSKKVKNLYYTGQLTVPGPGVPPSLISGQVVANLIEKEFGKNN
jgi:phytoene desaturase